MTKPDPLPTPSTDHDLTNITSANWLTTWDDYVKAILTGVHSFHGSDPGSEKKAASTIGAMADAMMEERQNRAQGHIDQGLVEKAKAKEEAAKPTKPRK